MMDAWQALLARLARSRQAVIISNGLTSAAIAAWLAAWLCASMPSRLSFSLAPFFYLSLRVSTSLSLNSEPYRVCRGQAGGHSSSHSFHPFPITTTTNATLVITTNLSRINSTSGINSSAPLHVERRRKKLSRDESWKRSNRNMELDGYCWPWNQKGKEREMIFWVILKSNYWTLSSYGLT